MLRARKIPGSHIKQAIKPVKYRQSEILKFKQTKETT